MSALFPPGADTLLRVAIATLVGLPLAAVGFLLLYVRTPLFTKAGHSVFQPIDFDHRHHVGDDGIDCRYCHDTVERSSTAGFPSTSLCLNCHSQLWNRSPILDALRSSYFRDRPLQWNRVHRLPGYVYFNHAIHVNKGVGCVTCHGRIDRMPIATQTAPLTMGWCLECHRDPASRLRPVEAMTQMDYRPPKPGTGKELQRRYDVHTRTSCTTCHR